MNDSYFSYLLAWRVLFRWQQRVKLIVFSGRKRSLRRAARVFRATYPAYFGYRTFVEVLTSLGSILGALSVGALARSLAIQTVTTANVNRMKAVLPAADLGVAINFDQMIGEELLQHYPAGVLNIHASRLPRDRGISPALWAFARNDKTIWTSIYLMDGGLDSGPIYRQFELEVRPGDTAFSVYERLCERSGDELDLLVQALERGESVVLTPQDEDDATRVNWPNIEHRRLMTTSGRHFVSARDLWRWATRLMQTRRPSSDVS